MTAALTACRPSRWIRIAVLTGAGCNRFEDSPNPKMRTLLRDRFGQVQGIERLTRKSYAKIGRVDANELLHHQRSAHLAQMPPANTLLSAGCAGAWYFDWVASYYGTVQRHIGLEFYMSRPEVLPDNVEWIENTVGDMIDVDDDSVDLVFSGQNLEHLWLEDMISFLCETSRVLRDGGHLVMDSPNRTQTEALRWPHPEHTVELTVAEAATALGLAGFQITKNVGVWLIETDSGHRYEFDCDNDADQITRVLTALDRPEQSFCWWMEAKRVADVDRPALARHLRSVFERAWPERLQRLRVLGAVPLPGSGDLVNEIGYPSIVMFGPYTPLPNGSYEVTFTFTGVEISSESPGEVDVMADEAVLITQRIPPIQPDQVANVTVPFSLDAEMTFGVQFRVISDGTSRFRTTQAIELIDHSSTEREPTYARSNRRPEI